MPIPTVETREQAGARSADARSRMSGRWGEHLFTAAWKDVLMVHLEVDPDRLASEVPFSLDLRDGRGFVTLVAFTMRDMRPAWGGMLGALGALMFRPIATHRFLNVRTYVRDGDDVGIHFLAEWLSSALAVRLGPPTFGLPYRHGRLTYRHSLERGEFSGAVEDLRTGGRMRYRGVIQDEGELACCEAGSADAWWMERYVAYTERRGARGYFRVWHPPWLRTPVDVEVTERELLAENWPWMRDARVVGAGYSPGFDDVWMGRPHRCGRRHLQASGVVR